MYRLFLVFLLPHLLIANPPIIYLKGTCCAGKSTYLESIKDDCDFEIVDEDAILNEIYREAISSTYPEEYKIIDKVISKGNQFHAFRLNEFLFNEFASSDECALAINLVHQIQDELNENVYWKNAVDEQVKKAVIEGIQEGIRLNKTVIVDCWYLSASHIQNQFPENHVLKVLFYCPIQKAYDRLLKRNFESLQKRNLEHKRGILNLVESYCSIYEVNEVALQPIEEVSKEVHERIFNLFYDSVQEDNKCRLFTFGEISKSQLRHWQNLFMKPFGEKDYLIISPKGYQDLIIHNDGVSAEWITDQIRILIFNQHHPHFRHFPHLQNH